VCDLAQAVVIPAIGRLSAPWTVRAISLVLQAGVARMYTGTAGRVENCQVGVLNLVISLVPEIVEDLLLFRADGGWESLDGAVDRDRGGSQGAELADNVADGQAGAVLNLAGDGQGCGHDGQVGLDRVALADEHRLGRQVCLAHPEGLLHVPQIDGESASIRHILQRAASDLLICGSQSRLASGPG
jgi:hypothetical protein